MSTKLFKLLGYIWSAPVTVFGLLYVLFMSLMGWYRWWGVESDALVWIVNVEKAPDWVLKRWEKWGGHTVGNVVVLIKDPDEKHVILTHELVHVRQCMILGVFQPVMYALIYLSIKASCKHSDAYFDNSFEIDARRACGQTIDIVGVQKKKEEAARKAAEEAANASDR